MIIRVRTNNGTLGLCHVLRAVPTDIDISADASGVGVPIIMISTAVYDCLDDLVIGCTMELDAVSALMAANLISACAEKALQATRDNLGS